jgi:hypothetical protein
LKPKSSRTAALGVLLGDFTPSASNGVFNIQLAGKVQQLPRSRFQNKERGYHEVMLPMRTSKMQNPIQLTMHGQKIAPKAG